MGLGITCICLALLIGTYPCDKCDSTFAWALLIIGIFLLANDAIAGSLFYITHTAYLEPVYQIKISLSGNLWETGLYK